MSKNAIERPGDLVPVADAELRQVEGGALVATGDGYCGTPYPWWPHATSLTTCPSDPSIVTIR